MTPVANHAIINESKIRPKIVVFIAKKENNTQNKVHRKPQNPLMMSNFPNAEGHIASVTVKVCHESINRVAKSVRSIKRLPFANADNSNLNNVIKIRTNPTITGPKFLRP